MDFFFDSHLHLTMKNQFSKEGNATSPWKAITRNDLKDGLKILEKLFGLNTLDKTFSSQSCPDQLIPANYKLVVAPLFAPDIDLVKAINSKKSFVRLLKKRENKPFGVILNFERYLKLQSTQNAFSIVENDFKLLEKADTMEPARSLSFIKSKSDFEEAIPNRLSVVFSVEGLHSLRSDLKEIDEDLILEDIESNLDKLVAKGATVLMANLTHIDNSNRMICNQAYAMDGMRANGFGDTELRPKGHGLTALGKSLVERLDSRNIAVDLKHMSVLARRDLYAFRREKGITSPLVSSHSGIAGIPFDGDSEGYRDFVFDTRKLGDVHKVRVAKVVKYDFSGLFPKVGFNASSISLFDEDIREIYDSNGLLGISMDERVLGYTRARKLEPDSFTDNVGLTEDGFGNRKRVMLDWDFVSDSEFEALGLASAAKGSKLRTSVDAEELIDMIRGNSANLPPYQFFHFLNHVLHCVALGEQFDGAAGVEKMLTKIICVGSDFDGLIDAMDWCVNCSHTRDIKNRFKEQFPQVLQKNSLRLPSGLSMERVADRLFFENGRDFVLGRLA
ncbi:membrane dipeptidase [Algoriphagus sp. H41]|uniref:Membrane dipeptidase n=1 Tax=Algoriphagus oliviformis TaxID=2811231 RepID=A0ABS3C0N4_9BACT|nr:membrane dipeptidase [Algoriphagus oliviformis]MBN7810465.1 membrane dipeptidase [Algoriphagus oliviformis]